MTIDEMVTLIQAVSENGLTSFEYEEGNQKLVLKKKEAVPAQAAPVVIAQPAAVMNPMPVEMPGLAGAQVLAGASPIPAEASAAAGQKDAIGLDIGSDHVVVSPLVGTFYSASGPEAEAFVKVGDRVKKGQILGIIEAMKLMNEIESEWDGVVEAILVNNEDVVEYGQPLFRIR